MIRRSWLVCVVVTASVPAGCEGPGGEVPEMAVLSQQDPAVVALYGPIGTEPFAVAALDVSRIDPQFRRQEVDYRTLDAPGTIIVDPNQHFLYLVEPGGKARRYGVAVGREGLAWSGTATIKTKQEWPDWYPTPEMLERRPDIGGMLSPLRGGAGIAGGLDNPIGARGLYLWKDDKDSLYRIHGTTEPYSIGQSVSSGCIRMTNQDVIDLYGRVSVGTSVHVLPVAPASATLVPASTVDDAAKP